MESISKPSDLDKRFELALHDALRAVEKRAATEPLPAWCLRNYTKDCWRKNTAERGMDDPDLLHDGLAFAHFFVRNRTIFHFADFFDGLVREVDPDPSDLYIPNPYAIPKNTRYILLRNTAATPTAWLPKLRFQGGASLVSSIHQVLDWAKEDLRCTTLGIVTMPILEIILRSCLPDNPSSAMEEWKRMGQSVDTLNDIREDLLLILRDHRLEVHLGRYGSCRNLHQLSKVDALVTLGEPNPLVYRVQLKAPLKTRLGRLFGLGKEIIHDILLQEAHRAPALSPCIRYWRILHVGSEMPIGDGWERGQMRTPTTHDRRRNHVTDLRSVVEQAIKRTGGIRALARATGYGSGTITRARRGTAMSRVFANRVHEVLAE